MLTKKDLEDINKIVKNQIEEAIAQIVRAVMEMMKTLATKEELQATKEELKTLATKEELRGIDRRLEQVEADVTDIKRDVRDIKADMPTREDFKTLKKLEEIHRKELGTYA